MKEHPGLAGLGGASVLVFLLGVGAAFWARSQRAAVVDELALLKVRAKGLSEAAVAPSEANVAEARADRARTVAIAADLLASLTEARTPLEPRSYGGAQELYFEVAAFLERMRAEASQNGVALAVDEQFGFGAFVAARQIILPGPEDSAESKAVMAGVDQELQALDLIVPALLGSGPTSLRAVERTPVNSVATDDDEALGADLFRVDPLLTAAQPGAIRTLGFRVVFTGRTHVLRDFLGQIAALPSSIVVRGVEVAPADDRRSTNRAPAGQNASSSSAPASNPTPAPASPFALFGNPSRNSGKGGSSPASGEAESASAPVPAAVPIVDANLSAFTVILEYYEVLPPPAESGEEEWE